MSISPDHEIEALKNLIRGLTAALHAGGEIDAGVMERLKEARAGLRALEGKREDTETQSTRSVPSPLGQMLGGGNVRVETKVKLSPVPTGVYHLLNPDTDALLTVSLTNDYEKRRVRVSAFIEGLSAHAIKTVELKPNGTPTIPLLPSLLPEQARRITEVQRATLNVEVVDLDEKVEAHDTYDLVMLARNSSFNSVVDPTTKRLRDLTKYYGAWVTPNSESVQALVRKAAEKVPERAIWGYQGKKNPEITTTQVRAIFDTLKEAGIVYVNSTIDFGAGPGQSTQRTRLPRESLRHKSANCIDGTVLFASLLECASLHPAIVLVPGHAYVGWETWQGSGVWEYLETTMISSHDFDAARKKAKTVHAFYEEEQPGDDLGPLPRVLKLRDLRKEGIYPME